jgi:hypothetical protein
MAVVLLGCPKKPGAGDAGAGDAAPPTASSAVEAAAPAAATVGANDADVTKYAGQNADNMESLTTRMEAHARTETGATGGKLVAALKPGTSAQRIADHEGYDLVLFADPADATKMLEGWVIQSAFGSMPRVVTVTDGGAVPVVVADAGPPKPSKPLDVKKSATGTCPAGYSTCGAMCRATCASDADCGLATAKCTGGQCLGPGASPCAH